MRKYKNGGAIAFPLGGIGTGSVSLAGDGRLIDWEIFNRPNRRSINSFTHFAVKAESRGKVLDCRVLQGDTLYDFEGGIESKIHSRGYGFGINRGTMAGIAHFENTSFEAYYPLAKIEFSDKKFPGKVLLEAFNPFIPSNDFDSSIPAAFFEFNIENTSTEDIEYTLAFSCRNPFEKDTVNEYKTADNVKFTKMTSSAYMQDETEFGSIFIGSDSDVVSNQEYWFRGEWFDELETFWREFSSGGKIKKRHYNEPRKSGGDVCTLAASVTLKAGESKNLRFLLSWYIPNVKKYWGDEKGSWKNYYTKMFKSGEETIRYCFKNWDMLSSKTKLFANTMMNSSLPECVHDAISGNIAILKSTTCLRLPSGAFYGWEGVAKDSGSCEGTCTHVWNYAYALPFLFPKLERSIRDAEYEYNFEETGKMIFRLQLPLGAEPVNMFTNHACVDGQMGGVMKVYREWKLSGDDEFLKKNWPRVKKSLEYAWSSANEDLWDNEKSGIITGRQHHTLDVELFGANAWLEGFYLLALKAAKEIASYLGEEESAQEYMKLFEEGKEWTEKNLFNGKHYIQKIDLKDKQIVEKFSAVQYWNEEENEIKYQIKDGCEIDQVVAAWHSDLVGLGEIFDFKRRKKSLETIYRLNFKSMRDINNTCRIFCVDDEKGAVICSWDEDEYKPKIPIPYSEETMCGFEYALACNMLLCGMEKEALEIVEAVRKRYDGIKRNPWAEIECGASYARSMASYSLLIAYSGFKFDLTRGMIGFKPVYNGNYFWSVDGAWGNVLCESDFLEIDVLYGQIHLKEVVHNLKTVLRVTKNNQKQEFDFENDKVCIDITLNSGEKLKIEA